MTSGLTGYGEHESPAVGMTSSGHLRARTYADGLPNDLTITCGRRSRPSGAWPC